MHVINCVRACLCLYLWVCFSVTKLQVKATQHRLDAEITAAMTFKKYMYKNEGA